MRVISVAYLALLNQSLSIQAQDDAEDAAWFDIYTDETHIKLVHGDLCIEYHKTEHGYEAFDKQQSLAFDHFQILLDALLYLQKTYSINIQA